MRQSTTSHPQRGICKPLQQNTFAGPTDSTSLAISRRLRRNVSLFLLCILSVYRNLLYDC